MVSQNLFVGLAVLPLLGLAAPTSITTPVTTSATATISLNSAEWCSSNSEIVSCFKKNPSQTPYCSSWNKISTRTTTTTITASETAVPTTITVTATPAATYWTTSTVTQSTMVHAWTEVSTSTITNTVTETSTGATYTPTCIATGTRQPPLNKRAATTAATQVTKTTTAKTTTNKYCYTSSYPPAGISSACSCLDLTTPTVTSTTTVTASTVTTVTEITTPTVTSTSIITTTATIEDPQPTTSWETATEIATRTTTTWSTTTTAVHQTNAIRYRKYTIPNDRSVYKPHYDTQQLKSLEPDFDQGELGLSRINLFTNQEQMYWPAAKQGDPLRRTPFGNMTALLQTFFEAGGDGDYTFLADAGPMTRYGRENQSLTGDWVTFWIGDNAYNWQNSDRAFDVSATTTEPSKWTSGSTTVTLRKGDIVPISIVWASGNDEIANLAVWVRLPYYPDGIRENIPPQDEWGFRTRVNWARFAIRPCDESPFT